jgi:[acyl-carrier-protein] S-malonyltransferase
MTSPSPRGDIAATVAGRAIEAEMVEARLAAVARGPMGAWLPASGVEDRRWKRWMAQLLVTEAVVLSEAEAEFDHAGVADDSVPTSNGSLPDEAARLEAAARSVFDRVTSNVVVEEEDIAGYYRRNLDRFRHDERRLVSHVLTADSESALMARERLDAGEDIAAVAAALSVDAGTRHRGGRLGEMRRGEMVGPFEDAVFACPERSTVGPVHTEFGWHVAVVVAVIPAGVEPFEAVRSEIEADLLSDARGRAFERWLEGRRQASATVEPGWEHPGDPRLPDFFHRH